MMAIAVRTATGLATIPRGVPKIRTEQLCNVDTTMGMGIVEEWCFEHLGRERNYRFYHISHPNLFLLLLQLLRPCFRVQHVCSAQPIRSGPVTSVW